MEEKEIAGKLKRRLLVLSFLFYFVYNASKRYWKESDNILQMPLEHVLQQRFKQSTK